MNNITMRVAAQPGVTVVDDNDAPVAGAEVTFQAPAMGPSGSFFGGMRTHTVKSDATGKATASGFIPNDNTGKFQIMVRATSGGAVAEGLIDQTNGTGPGGNSGGTKMSSKQKKILAFVAVGVVAAIAGGVAAGGDNTSATAAKTPVSIGAGPITVGGPR